jgi:hypothetical protein
VSRVMARCTVILHRSRRKSSPLPG